MARPALIIHGGAGSGPPDLDAVQRAGCVAAVEAGWQLLRSGSSAVDAVCAAVTSLEDDTAFNAGHGSCLTSAGTVEMDASVMDGHTLAAGAVAVVRSIPNPVRLARAVMEDGRHLMFAAGAAEDFARARGIATCAPEALVTERQRRQWQQARNAADTAARGHSPGTVGAVAVDTRGHVAAATSTGGLAFKRPGRVGDSAIIGAGTFADDELGAASATGLGEDIIRIVLAYRVVAALRAGEEPMQAADGGIRQLAQRTGATGGIIVVDPLGRLGYASNTARMPVAYMRADLSGIVVNL